jgi:hypothetical protein
MTYAGVGDRRHGHYGDRLSLDGRPLIRPESGLTVVFHGSAYSAVNAWRFESSVACQSVIEELRTPTSCRHYHH